MKYRISALSYAYFEKTKRNNISFLIHTECVFGISSFSINSSYYLFFRFIMLLFGINSSFLLSFHSALSSHYPQYGRISSVLFRSSPNTRIRIDLAEAVVQICDT